MNASWKICRLFGIQLEIHYTFVLLLAYYAYNGYQAAGPTGALAALITISLVFVSVVLHELGHSLTALRYGIPVPRIVLLPIGGMAQMARIPKEPKKELILTINGPLVNFVLAAILWGALQCLPERPGLHFFTLNPIDQIRLLFMWNIVMGLFNLLPIFPMDGGRIFRALLAMKLPYAKATFIAATVAKVLAGLGIAYALLISHDYLLAILLTFIWVGGEAEYKQVRLMEKYAGRTIRDITRLLPPAALAAIAHSRPILQASWPLEPYAAWFNAQPGRTFPVYDGLELIGVVHTDDLRQ